jgi:hypothetical protein
MTVGMSHQFSTSSASSCGLEVSEPIQPNHYGMNGADDGLP